MTILIADDNRDFLVLAADLLRMHGHNPLVVADGKEACDLIERERVDVIVSDVFMPGLDGLQFHSYVRNKASNRSIPFVFVSGYDDPYTLEAIADRDLDFFVSKRMFVREIISTLERVEAKLSAKLRSGVSRTE